MKVDHKKKDPFVALGIPEKRLSVLTQNMAQRALKVMTDKKKTNLKTSLFLESMLNASGAKTAIEKFFVGFVLGKSAAMSESSLIKMVEVEIKRKSKKNSAEERRSLWDRLFKK